MKAHQRDIELAHEGEHHEGVHHEGEHHEGGGPWGYEQPAEGGAGAKPAD
jgi:hypothetical protein